MKILITNDDGVHSEGIKILGEAMADLGEIRTVAPDRDRSGASNSLTLHKPLRVTKVRKNRFSVEGTPSDSVHLALTGYLDFEPDLVVSGINHGANLGDDVLYSGTVAGALEARMLGLPAIAFSLAGSQHMDTAKMVAKYIVQQYQTHPLKRDSLLNVNIPDIPFSEITGYAVTRTGSRHPAEDAIPQKDPRGNQVYWIGCVGEQSDAGEGTDFYAISKKQVSITPLHVDLTHHDILPDLIAWAGQFKG